MTVGFRWFETFLDRRGGDAIPSFSALRSRAVSNSLISYPDKLQSARETLRLTEPAPAPEAHNDALDERHW
jgi:hypothetical protein